MVTTPTADIGKMTQFDWLYNALVNKYPGLDTDGKTNQFQFMATPMTANWTIGTDSDAQSLADATSVTTDGFFTKGDSLSEAYMHYVTSIAVDATSNQTYKNLYDQVGALGKQLQSLVTQARSQFKVFLANNPGAEVTFDAWCKDPLGGRSFGDQVSQITAQEVELQKSIDLIVATIDGPLQRARSRVTPAFVPSMKISRAGGQVVDVAAVSIQGDLAGDVANWVSRGAGAAPDFDVTLTGHEHIEHPWIRTYSTKTKADCWGASTTTKVNTRRILEDTNYRLRVQAVAVNTYDIHREAWFDAELVKSQRPVVKGGPYTDDSFFGPNGSLHLLPQTIVVMFRPKISLTMTTEIYEQEIEGNFSAGIEWINMLGMKFDIDGMASLQAVKSADNTTTITLDSADNQKPTIIGVMCEVVAPKA